MKTRLILLTVLTVTTLGLVFVPMARPIAGFRCYRNTCPPCGIFTNGVCCDWTGYALICTCQDPGTSCTNNIQWDCYGQKFTGTTCSVNGCSGANTGFDCWMSDTGSPYQPIPGCSGQQKCP
jgi:hypothetical protein